MTSSPPLHTHAERIAKQLARGATPTLGDDLRSLLEENPTWVMDGLKGIIDTDNKPATDPNWLLESYCFLLAQQLELLRYGVDRGRTENIEIALQFQHRVVGLARNGLLSTFLLSRIAVMLRDAKLPPIPELFEVASELMRDAPLPVNQDLSDIRRLLQEMAKEAEGDLFRVAEGLTEFTYAMPADALAMVAELLLNEPALGLADAVPLMMLDDRPEVRQLLGQVLKDHASQLGPDSLRRLIALRNWLPEGERKTLDETIRLARRAGIECARWPDPPPVEILASAIDGSAAQGLFFISQSGRKHQISSTLLRLGKGVLDAWTLPDLPKRQREAILSDVMNQMPMTTVSRSYADLALQHHLWTAVQGGSLPPVATLKVAESIGASHWLPQQLDLKSTLEQLLPEVPQELLASDRVKEILGTSADWAQHSGICRSWFEDDQEIDLLLSRSRASKRETLVKKILTEILQPRAGRWAERCLWAALWCRESTPELRRFWPHFLIVARAITDNCPLKQISLMSYVADETLEAALHRQ